MKINKRKNRIVFLISIMVISILGLSFTISVFRDNMVFYYSPSEINAQNKNKSRLKVGGLVVEGSYKKDGGSGYEFLLTDTAEVLKIKYEGILPDLFREGQGVIAEGKFINDEFVASSLLVKHDENYMPPEVAKSLKKYGQNPSN